MPRVPLLRVTPRGLPVAAMTRAMEGDLGLSFDSESVRSTYDAWGDVVDNGGDVNKSVYAKTVRDWGYECPEHATQILVRALSTGAIPKSDHANGLRILDVGCADGLQAESLCKAGVLREGDENQLDGMDLSPKLLQRARESGKYKNLYCDDLNRCDWLGEDVSQCDVATAPYEDDHFHVTFCVGVLTYVDPDAYLECDEFKKVPRRNLLRELSRITQNLVIFTCRTDMCSKWEEIADAMEKEGTWQTFERKKVPYLPGNKSYHEKGVEANLYAYVVS